MALLTENRNRVPLIAVAPVDGQTEGVRGDLRMIVTDGNLVLHVCTTAGPEAVSGSTVVWSTVTAT